MALKRGDLHMIKTIAMAMFSLVFFLEWQPIAYAENIKVIDIKPEPNYKLSLNEGDYLELTDKKTTTWPIWTKKSSIGFENATPVLIEAMLEEESEFDQILLHFSKGNHAGVKIPRRIDVYCVSDGVDTHVGGENFSDELFTDGKNHWVRVQLTGLCNQRFFVAIHANGNYIMLDEIKVERNGFIPNETQIEPIENIADDSVHRLKNFMLSEYSEKLAQRAEALDGSSAFFAKIIDPWGRLSPSYQDPPNPTKYLVIPYNGLADFVIEVANISDTSDQFLISLDRDIRWELNRIDPVLTAEGKTVLDILSPLNIYEFFKLIPDEIKHFLVTIPGDKLEVGDNLIDVIVRNSSDNVLWQDDIRIYRSAPRSISEIDIPNITIWSYTSDTPIWSNKALDTLLRQLNVAGVNVHFVHHSKIPSLGDKPYDKSKNYRVLVEELRVLSGKGLILLYLHWEKKLAGLEDDPTKIHEWLDAIERITIDAGLDYKDWALYPVDELTNEKFENSHPVFEIIKDFNPKIQTYVTIDGIGKNRLDFDQLSSISPYIDFWQANFPHTTDSFESFASKSGIDGWWIYSNGPGIPKRRLPNCYRAIARDALRLGAEGFGFWSFSDTGNSSAIDDFDGRRPDWAVVYETNDGYQSSRRWEAFKRGVDEFKYLKSCENKNDLYDDISCVMLSEYFNLFECIE